MNMIYAGEIAPMVQNSPPDWEAIALKIKTLRLRPAKEIYLRGQNH